DMTIRVFALPDNNQQAALNDLEARGVRRTWITETVTMASSNAAQNPLLISVKAIDPRVYPFYGEVTLNPPQRLDQVLTPDTVVVSEDTLVRLNVHTGDSLRIGGPDFRILSPLPPRPAPPTGAP